MVDQPGADTAFITMEKKHLYSSKTIDSFEILADKLANDLRKNIRNLVSFAYFHSLHDSQRFGPMVPSYGTKPTHTQESCSILSEQWLEMTEIFGRVANITDMESKLSSSKNESATLWETEEQALRFMLEDGKMNLCLRSLAEFKKTQINCRTTNDGVMVINRNRDQPTSLTEPSLILFLFLFSPLLSPCTHHS